MTYSIDDILTVSTRDEQLSLLLSLANDFGAPTTSWVEGDPVLTLLTTVAQVLSDLSYVVLDIAKAGFGDDVASDDWADVWAKSRFNVERVPASAAAGGGGSGSRGVNLTNSSLTQYDLEPGDLIVSHSVTGATYTNTETIAVLATTGLDDVAIACTETGTFGNAAPGFITHVIPSLIGVGCTNPEAILGADKETTPNLIARARRKLSSLSPNGPKDVYNYLATTPSYSDVSVAITRTSVVLGENTGALSVYLATASGAASAPDVAIVQEAFEAYGSPWGSRVTAIPADELTQAVTYSAWIRGSGLTVAQAKSKQADALATYFSNLPLGGDVIPPGSGSLYVETLEQVISESVPGTVRVVATLPSNTVAVGKDQVCVLGTITATVSILI